MSSETNTVFSPISREISRHYMSRIKWLKYFLVITSFILIAMLIFWPIYNDLDWKLNGNVNDVTSNENLSFAVKNARYAGLESGNLPFTITAQSVLQDKNLINESMLLNPKADILLENGDWLYLTSNQGVVEDDKNRLHLKENVNLFYSEGMEFDTESIRMNTKLGVIIGDEYVEGRSASGTLSGQGIYIHNSGKNVKLIGKSKLMMY